MTTIHQTIASELKVRDTQVQAAVQLLDEGATVPFISRYRKEVTGGLDDTQLRALQERLLYLRELEARRESIIKNIDRQGNLTPDLEALIKSAETKMRLEDLYLPYKKKRRTKGQVAIECGLKPLADTLYENPALDPYQEAKQYLNPEFNINEIKQALDGARYILMERFAENAQLLEETRALMGKQAYIYSSLLKDQYQEASKYKDYFEYSESLRAIPSHRALAILRGRREGFLSLTLDLPDAKVPDVVHPCEKIIARTFAIKHLGRPADDWLSEVVRMTWRIKLHTYIEADLMMQLRERAELEAISVFGRNLKDLLLSAPAGAKVTIGLDPGLRTGVKVALVSETGKLLDHATIYPHAPKNQWDQALATLHALVVRHKVKLIAIGNGTASRETDKLVAEFIRRYPELGIQKIMISEAGASVYSASELAAQEFPDLDVTIRGAVSIARRLQDPLAELVKIEPKSIGVGQYQHDVNQTKLAQNLDTVVEDCVNAVGVEVNTASSALLRHVSGLNATIANNIVQFRDQNGAFRNRQQLRDVPRLGEKTYEQAIGFLRIAGGELALDASAVHPESYFVVEDIARQQHKSVDDLVGNSALLKTLDPNAYVNEQVGLPTVIDIISELDKPGRDPRPAFKVALYKEGVETIADLEVSMMLEGTVTNVTNFGAFVDIGVHQDGLVHISALSKQYIKDPHTIVKAGDIVKVKIMDIDIERKRIALSMRLDDMPADISARSNARSNNKNKQKNSSSFRGGKRKQREPETMGTMAALFVEAQKKHKLDNK